MATQDYAFYQPVGGTNTAGEPDRLSMAQFARLVNGAIDEERVGTRLAARVIPITGETAEIFATGNYQGGMRYNPAEGQGAITVGADVSSLLLAAAGRKFQINFAGGGVNTSATITELTNALVSAPDLHLVCWLSAENFALAGDGNGNTWIWNGIDPATVSTGYNNTDREASMVPNGGMAMCYVHGRIAMVVNSRAILYGDLLNQRDLVTAKDVLRYVDQTYDATSQYFSPPTAMGPINALAVLPIQDTAHGHGETMAHCWNGIFSVNSNIWPRSLWSNAPMVKCAYLGGGAVGPYAVDIYSGDQFFRSRSGVQTLRSARAETQQNGAPRKSVAQTVGDFLKFDAKKWLRFCSVKCWQEENRGFVTCYPIVAGAYRWHRGAVVCNFDPVPVQSAPSIWEGLWTLPPEIGGPVQFLAGDFDSEDRLFAVCYSPLTKRNTLVEFRRDLTDDILPDGSRRRIRGQLVTRRMDATNPGKKKNWESASLYLSGVRGTVDWGVWVRSFGKREWVFWRGGQINNCPTCGDGCNGLGEAPAWEGEIPLGSLQGLDGKAFVKVAKNVQFLVRWAGRCQVESIVATFDSNDPDEGKFDQGRLCVTVKECNREFVEYDDYEYADKNEADSWLQITAKKP